MSRVNECPRGHKYTAENTYQHPTRDERRCRTCNREQQARRRRRQASSPMPAFVFAIDRQLSIDRGDVHWMQAGNCASAPDPDIFYANPQKQQAIVLDALGYCAGCPVADQCLQFAMSNDETHGVWGGLTAPQRRALSQPALTTAISTTP